VADFRLWEKKCRVGAVDRLFFCSEKYRVSAVAALNKYRVIRVGRLGRGKAKVQGSYPILLRSVG
jgi:hypothetical protein